MEVLCRTDNTNGLAFIGASIMLVETWLEGNMIARLITANVSTAKLTQCVYHAYLVKRHYPLLVLAMYGVFLTGYLLHTILSVYVPPRLNQKGECIVLWFSLMLLFIVALIECN